MIMVVQVFLAVVICFFGGFPSTAQAAEVSDFNRKTSNTVWESQDHPSRKALTSSAALLLLTKEERRWLSKHPVIRVVQDPAWPPVEFVDEQGKPSGMAGDYLTIVEEKLGLKFEWVGGLSWQEAYQRLQKHEIDMTTSVAETSERTKFWSFTKPYMKIPIVIVTHANVTYIDDMRELIGKKVAVVDGYAVSDWIPHDFPDITLIKVSSVQEGLALLQREKVFAYIDNMLVVGYYLAKLQMTNLKIAGKTPYVNAQCMAVRKDWEPLAGILQKALASISEPQRSDIYRKWLPVRYEHGFDYKPLWQALALFALILAALLLRNRRLSSEMKRRSKIEAALLNSEEKFRLVFEAANVGKSITLPTGNIQANKAFCDMVGYTQEELKNKKWQELTHPDDVESNRRSIDLLLRGKQDSFRLTKRYLHKNGSFIWADVSIAVQRDSDHKPLFLITTIVDITERKLAEDALQKKSREMQLIFKNMTNAFIIWKSVFNENGKYISFRFGEFNDAYARIAGVTPEEVWGKDVFEVWPGTELSWVDVYGGVAVTGISKTFDMYHEPTKGWYHCNAYRPTDSPMEICVIFEDITERKIAEENVRQINEQLEKKVDERTAELKAAIAKLEKLNRVFVGRELEMARLKKRITELEQT
jgi:PAS domain S-box-containing protein